MNRYLPDKSLDFNFLRGHCTTVPVLYRNESQPGRKWIQTLNSDFQPKVPSLMSEFKDSIVIYFSEFYI